MHIETNGYLLRSVVPADITTGVVDWINDQTMREGLNLPPLGLNLDRTRAFVESFDGLRQHFIGIFDPKSKLMIGFYTMDVSLEHRSANITCGIGEASYRGRRVLWHTIDALLDHFFTYRNIDKITARVLSRNIPMLFNFVDNPRFVWEAKLKRECLGVDGSRLDLLLFAAHRDARREDGTAP
ncbi:GNAT family N-acetyltransferase [Dyella sp. C9]|uniref:GNAT family N-acetyltransferase n=1 Tax=Dyella sp. C9 TaxID=2202154 RepID=UPI0018E56CB5|nr:GNAT family protein [Dyella sp. C9]